MKKILLFCSTLIATAFTTNTLADITINNKTGSACQVAGYYQPDGHSFRIVEPNTSKSFPYRLHLYPEDENDGGMVDISEYAAHIARIAHLERIKVRKVGDIMFTKYLYVDDNDIVDVTENSDGKLQMQKQ